MGARQPFDDLAKHLLAGRGVLRLGVVQPLPDLERTLQLVARLGHGLPERLDLGGPVLRLDEVDLLGRVPDAFVRRDQQRIGFARERAGLAIAFLCLAPAPDRPDDEEHTADDQPDEQQRQQEPERASAVLLGAGVGPGSPGRTGSSSGVVFASPSASTVATAAPVKSPSRRRGSSSPAMIASTSSGVTGEALRDPDGVGPVIDRDEEQDIVSPIELIRKVSEAYSVAGCPSVDSTKRTHAWTRSSSRVRSIAPVTSATSSTPALSVTGPSSAGGGSALAGTVATASNPRTRAARTTARRIRGSVDSSGSVAAGRCRWVHRRGATLRACCSASARATCPEVRWRGAPSAASSSRCRGRLRPVPGGGPLRTPEDQDPIRLRRAARFDAPQLGHLAAGRDVVECNAGQGVALRCRGRFPDALRQPDAAPDRAAAICLDVPDDEHDDRVVGQDGAHVPQHVPKEGEVWLAMMGVVQAWLDASGVEAEPRPQPVVVAVLDDPQVRGEVTTSRARSGRPASRSAARARSATSRASPSSAIPRAGGRAGDTGGRA